MSFIYENKIKTNDVLVECNFSLYPMHQDFVQVILDALRETDTSKIEAKTDALSTTYKGNILDVFKTVQTLFIHAYNPSVHMALEGRISKVEMGNKSLSYNSSELITEENFPVLCKFSLYEFKQTNALTELFEIATKDSLRFNNENDIYYLEGEVNKVFSFLNQVYLSVNTESNNCILHFTLSVNSPTIR